MNQSYKVKKSSTEKVFYLAVALGMLTSYGIHKKDFGGTTHPPSYDRLIHTLSRFIHDDNHVVWAVVAFAMKLHLDISGTKTPNVEYNSCAACAEGYANTLANNFFHQ